MSQNEIRDLILSTLSQEYERAESIVKVGTDKDHFYKLVPHIKQDIKELFSRRHNGRGVALTLTVYKLVKPSQDIRAHKSEHSGGFNARSIDTDVVVPFLRSHSLSNASATHWLTQVFSGAPYTKDQILKTQPKSAGEIVPRLVSAVNELKPDLVRLALCMMFVALINERNIGVVELTKPKSLTIDKTIKLIMSHFNGNFSVGGPRLPQIAIYAVYQCLVGESKRYEGCHLLPLERLKAANRKSGSVGDIDVLNGKRAFEAVEIKYKMPIDSRHVSDAIEKIKSADVKRYYLLSTDGMLEADNQAILESVKNFYRTNGCEIIVNGIYETLKYYLRMINDIDVFIANYVELINSDRDVAYEHRIAWNEACDIVMG